ncbi:Acyl carrier protein [Olavius algarvensis spirochete endosymbiont]|uniref:acyl carrier protein n=1 Tax=Olavius algarvensis spirochete endosymbiont TaxID=260710 RepID=UPI000F0D879C|nr:acyl carrier protein [Olavius algarvensis spirochete endosymbiont]VDB00083.1 Acyl carrier protein [Olavius algarvensis spirochete endosymbiont]
MSTELFEKLKDLIADRLEVDKDKIAMDSRFREDLGADSLDTYELLYAIDSELGVSVPDEKATEFEKVQDALAYIEEELKTKE